MDGHIDQVHRTPDPIADPAISESPSAKPIRVLLVDDSASSLVQLQGVLTSFARPCRVRTAANGQEAISYLQTDGADLVITDLEMPYGDGFSILSFIKRSGKNVPVIVATGMAPNDYDARLDPFGSVVVLAKPVDRSALEREVTMLLQEASTGRLRGVTLPGFLQLIEMERKSCAIRVRTNDFMGRLHFLSGELVNAFTFDDGVEGEAAARRLLAVENADLEIERSYHNHKRLIDLPLQTLLLEVAAEHDLELEGVRPTMNGVRSNMDGRPFDRPVPTLELDVERTPLMRSDARNDGELQIAVERLLRQAEVLSGAASSLTKEATALKARLDQRQQAERLRADEARSIRSAIVEILKALEETLSL
jgi:CheY-like chemotaxis protein